MTDPSRRRFLKGVGLGTAAATLGGLGSLSPLLRQLSAGERHALQQRVDQWLPTVCGQCPAGCGMLVRVVDGRAVKIDGLPPHPSNRGKTCPKGQNGLQTLYDPDRLRGPMKQIGQRGSGDWQSITWDQAIGEVVSRLSDLRVQGLAHTVAFVTGEAQGQMEGLVQRFCAAFGTPNYINHKSILSETTSIAHELQVGHRQQFGYDWENTNYVLSFGVPFLENYQPIVRNLRLYGHMRRGRPNQRARFVQVDSRLSVTATKADEWIPSSPGTEGALALGIAFVIINENLYDHDFVNRHTFGFDDWTDDAGGRHMGFRTLVLRDYAPSQVEAITGVSAGTIARLAREFATNAPAVALADRSVSMQSNGLYAQMAVDSLNALVGSIDTRGGPIVQRQVPYVPWPEVQSDSSSREGVAQPRLDLAGTTDYPLAQSVYQQLPASVASEEPYPINALLLYYTNPLFSSPEVEPVRAALKKVPFIVSFSPFLDDSSTYADLILPDHTFLERLQDVELVPSTGYPVVGLRQPVVSPLFDTRNSGDVLLQIAHDLGGTVAESFPWSSFEELLQYRISGLWRSEQGDIIATEYPFFWQEFMRRSFWSDPPYRFGAWTRVFNTPSGRFEFYSQRLKQALDSSFGAGAGVAAALPRLGVNAEGDEAYLPHHEPIQQVGDSAEYPFVLNTYRMMTHAGGRGANQPHLQELLGVHVGLKWDSWIEINPSVARSMGIEHGELVVVESAIGEKLEVRAVLYEGARPEVVNMPFELGHEAYGRWAKDRGVNPNRLMANDTNSLTGTLNVNATRVKIQKA